MKVLFICAEDSSLMLRDTTDIYFGTDDDVDKCTPRTYGIMTLCGDSDNKYDRCCPMTYEEYEKIIKQALHSDVLDLSDTPYEFAIDDEDDDENDRTDNHLVGNDKGIGIIISSDTDDDSDEDDEYYDDNDDDEYR